MSDIPAKTPLQICEGMLRDEKRYNEDRGILSSHNKIIDCFLNRRDELKDAYEELYNKLHNYPYALNQLLKLVICSAAYWDPESLKQARSSRKELVMINTKIASLAAELANLLDSRDDMHNTSGFRGGTHYHVCGVIENASRNNYLFERYVQEKRKRP